MYSIIKTSPRTSHTIYEHLSRQDAVQVLEDVKNGYLRCGDNVTVYGQDDDMRLSITEKDKSDEITYAIVKNI